MTKLKKTAGICQNPKCDRTMYINYRNKKFCHACYRARRDGYMKGYMTAKRYFRKRGVLSGFICPWCFTSHESKESLQQHQKTCRLPEE